ncbi:hypothetical protein MRX96_005229 [Rhipicephalus microplus]
MISHRLHCEKGLASGDRAALGTTPRTHKRDRQRKPISAPMAGRDGGRRLRRDGPRRSHGGHRAAHVDTSPDIGGEPCILTRAATIAAGLSASGAGSYTRGTRSLSRR